MRGKGSRAAGGDDAIMTSHSTIAKENREVQSSLHWRRLSFTTSHYRYIDYSVTNPPALGQAPDPPMHAFVIHGCKKRLLSLLKARQPIRDV